MYAPIVIILKWPTMYKGGIKKIKGRCIERCSVWDQKSCEVHTLGKVHKSWSVAYLNSAVAVRCQLDITQLHALANFSVSISVGQGLHLQRF